MQSYIRVENRRSRRGSSSNQHPMLSVQTGPSEVVPLLFKPNSTSGKNKTKAWLKPLLEPNLCYRLGLNLQNKKNNNKILKKNMTIPDGSCPWQVLNSGSNTKNSCLNCDSGSSPLCVSSFRIGLVIFSSIIPCHTLDECFLSSANPK